MASKLPLPRGWKRRVKSSVLHLLQSTCWNNGPLHGARGPVHRHDDASIDPDEQLRWG